MWTNQSAFLRSSDEEEDDCVSSDDGDGEEEETKTVVMRLVMVTDITLSAAWLIYIYCTLQSYQVRR